MEKQKFLICIDGSYFCYYALFGAVSEFKEKYSEEASLYIKPAEECDQENLPDLLVCNTFKKVLKKFVAKRLETIDYIAKANFQNELDIADKIDFVFAMDDRLKNSFRLEMYPQYKAQRRIAKKQFQLQPIKDYIIDVIFKELEVEEKYGYCLVKVDGAEGDDVVATTLMRLKDKYIGSMLIASDHDFLQIENVHEFDLFGREAKRMLGDVEVSAKEYLLGKILMGDKSDNIQQVFSKCGPKTAYKLVKDPKTLKNLLDESEESSQRFLLNKKMISFNEIPEDLSNKIFEKLNEKLYDISPLNDKPLDIKDFMNL